MPKIEEEAENIKIEAIAETSSDLNRKQTPTPRDSNTKQTPTPRDSLKRQNTGITSPPPIIEDTLENLTPLEEILNKVNSERIDNSGIVHFIATPLKGRFVVF